MLRLLAASLALFSALCHGEEPIKQNLVMGFVPSRSVHEIQVSSKKIADYLSQTTGYSIKAITLSNYAGVALAMKSKRVDFAFVGPINYLVIEDRAGAVPLTAAVRHGNKGYRGIIIARADSGIRKLEDLRGKSVAFGDALSASASLYPKAALLEAGINPKKDIKALILTSQSAVVTSVLTGKVDAGAIYDDARLNPEVLKYYPDAATLTEVIYQTPVIPGDPQIARASLNPQQQKKLTEALLAMSRDDKAKGWLKEIYGIDSLDIAAAEEYDGLRSVVQRVDSSLLSTIK
jgi:phosphonate transport system substrate-binding protein